MQKRSKDSKCRKLEDIKQVESLKKIKKKQNQLMLFLMGTKKGIKPEIKRRGGKKKRERKRLGM